MSIGQQGHPITTYRDLILDTGDVEQGLDLGPQLVPWPGAQLQVLAQVALHDFESQTLLLALEEVLAGQVSSHPGLHPGHDLGQTLVTELLHLTQHSGTEEHLYTSSAANTGRDRLESALLGRHGSGLG